MRTSLKTAIFILALSGVTGSVRSNDDDVAYVPERMAGPAEWIGKSAGRLVDATVSQAWSWATDARYDGLTKLRRFGALGCFGFATYSLATDIWRQWRLGNRRYGVSWKPLGLSLALGALLTMRPEPVYVPYVF